MTTAHVDQRDGTAARVDQRRQLLMQMRKKTAADVDQREDNRSYKLCKPYNYTKHFTNNSYAGEKQIVKCVTSWRFP